MGRDEVSTGSNSDRVASSEIQSAECAWTRSLSLRYRPRVLGDRNLVRKINVLDRIQQFHAFVHWSLERFASGDQAHAAAAFVDDGGAHGFGHVAGAFRLTTGIDQPDASHVAIGDLIAH